jgi:hypothetical protein
MRDGARSPSPIQVPAGRISRASKRGGQAAWAGSRLPSPDAASQLGPRDVVRAAQDVVSAGCRPVCGCASQTLSVLPYQPSSHGPCALLPRRLAAPIGVSQAQCLK